MSSFIDWSAWRTRGPSEDAFMKHWKVAGELVRPKNMTVDSKKPLWVTKVAFH